MHFPLQITFRGLTRSPALEADIRERAEKLGRFFERIISGRVLIEARHRHHHRGFLYHLRIELSVPGEELVVDRDPRYAHEHEEAYAAVRDAFDAMKRKLDVRAERIRASAAPRLQEPAA